MGNEMAHKYYDEVYEKENRYRDHYSNVPFFPVYQVALSMIKDINSPSILELGCGTGQFAHMLWDNGLMTYQGIDFSETAIGIASGLSPQVFEVGDIRNYIIKPGVFNTIVILEVLEHITYDLSLLERLPLGMNIVLSVPNFDETSHVRHFKTKQDIVNRYGEIISLEDIVKYRNWYVVKGVIGGKNNNQSIKERTA